MRDIVKTILQSAGITINGDQPFDITINDDNFFRKLMSNPSLAAGEGYMNNEWDCQQLDELFYRLLLQTDGSPLYRKSELGWHYLKSKLTNMQSLQRSKKVAKKHYNLDNDLFHCMLGDSMAYTCGYWDKADSLDAAQQAKYDLVCRKLNLQPGQTVLDLGCGWGGFSNYAATHYGTTMVAVNIAAEQINYGRQQYKDLPITFYEADYRDTSTYNPDGKPFDHIACVGLCEHIGYKNYNTFIQVLRQQLKPDGLVLLHTIGKNNSLNFVDTWVQKYIFPQGMLPSIALLTQAVEDIFIVEDLHNFGADYDKTLMAWHNNFVAHWDTLKNRFDERFFRMWNYYLQSCAGTFRARQMQLWQFVLSPAGVPHGYKNIR